MDVLTGSRSDGDNDPAATVEIELPVVFQVQDHMYLGGLAYGRSGETCFFGVAAADLDCAIVISSFPIDEPIVAVSTITRGLSSFSKLTACLAKLIWETTVNAN